jgi:hypothetical protein
MRFGGGTLQWSHGHIAHRGACIWYPRLPKHRDVRRCQHSGSRLRTLAQLIEALPLLRQGARRAGSAPQLELQFMAMTVALQVLIVSMVVLYHLGQ